MTGSISDPKEGNTKYSTRYILITQCLQNDFFLNNYCKLRLPVKTVKNMLVGNNGPEIDASGSGDKLKFADGYPANGPLGKFLSALRKQRETGSANDSILHIINIRDCHDNSAAYDKERRVYGAHCEKNSWGSDYIEGLEEILDPARKGKDSKADGDLIHAADDNKVNTYHVTSDSLFDFRLPADKAESAEKHLRFKTSLLGNILDIIISGTEEHVSELSKLCNEKHAEEVNKDTLEELAHQANKLPNRKDRVYIAVIGVYTDIKVKILLTCLRTRYDIPNLAVSDTLTASVSMGRHLGALDFACKILNVEIIHGLNNLLRFLGGRPDIQNEKEIVAAERYLDYSTYFQDKQNVLAYESGKLKDYLELTRQKSENVYNMIEKANQFLLLWGKLFLGVSLIGLVAAAFIPQFKWEPFAAIGSVGLGQVILLFFSRPMSNVQKNLTNLAVFRMVMESHSLKTALARFHLTTPQVLREDADEEANEKQVSSLMCQMKALEAIEKDYNILKDLGFGAEMAGKKPKTDDGADAANGSVG